MTTLATADGYAGGWPGGVTADGWPTQAIPVTGDGFVTPFTGGGGGGGGGSGGSGNGGHGGGGGGGGHHHGHSGGGFHAKKKRKHTPIVPLDQIFSDTADIYDQLTNPQAPAEHREAAGDIVRAHATTDRAIPQRAAVNWQALHEDAAATAKLMALWHKRQIEMDDEDFWLLGD